MDSVILLFEKFEKTRCGNSEIIHIFAFENVLFGLFGLHKTVQINKQNKNGKIHRFKM